MRTLIVLLATALAGLAGLAGTAGAATAPAPIQLFVDCVAAGSNGSYSATFGYLSPNTAPVTIQAGSADNFFTPGPADRGQPSTFQPGTNHGAVTVSGIPDGTSLVWTVSYGGTTETATVTGTPTSTCTTPQPVHVFVDCVAAGSNGSYSATFGYLSENGAPVTVPAGSVANSFTPAPADRGQPSTFQPGTHHDAFTVSGIPSGTSLVWTLSYAGQTRTTTASASFATTCATQPQQGGQQGQGHRVAVCHRTGSWRHPYVEIEVDEHAVRAHLRHGDELLGATAGSCPTAFAAAKHRAHGHGREGEKGHGRGHDD